MGILLLSGRVPLALRAIGNYSTATAAFTEDLIKPSVCVDYTKLWIDGKFVDSASGECFYLFFFVFSFFLLV